MIKYFCKNGETVFVTAECGNPEQIVVEYKGKKYRKPKSIIGKTLFKEDPRKVHIGSKVTLTETITHKKTAVEIIRSETTAKYLGMGGAYYGARVAMESSSRAGEKSNGRVLVTEISPLGKAVLGKMKNDIVEVIVDNQHTKYTIDDIDNTF